MPLAVQDTTSATPPTSATCRLEDQVDAYLSLDDLEIPVDVEKSQKGYGSLVLSNLVTSFVDLCASTSNAGVDLSPSKGFEAIYLYNLENTVVLLPETNNGSIMIRGCTGCHFILAAHQVCLPSFRV